MSTQRPPLAFSLLFAVIGLAAGGFGIKLTADTRSFVSRADRATGQVVELTESHSSDSTSYYPVVEFSVPGRPAVRFSSNSGSNPPSHRVGDSVNVLYDPADPGKAEIDGFVDLWMGPLILGGMGTVFALVGILTGIASLRMSKRERLLRTAGRRLTATVEAIEPVLMAGGRGRTGRLTIGGLSIASQTTGTAKPRIWRVIAAWTDETGAKRTFASDLLKKDPSGQFAIGAPIDVFVDPGNFGDYVVDLPKPAAR